MTIWRSVSPSEPARSARSSACANSSAAVSGSSASACALPARNGTAGSPGRSRSSAAQDVHPRDVPALVVAGQRLQLAEHGDRLVVLPRLLERVDPRLEPLHLGV